jgi:hypothetical protein
MYCQKCGSQIDDGSIFCTECGASQNSDQAKQNTSAQPLPTQPKKKKGCLISAIAVFSVLILIIIIASLGGKDKASKPVAASASPSQAATASASPSQKATNNNTSTVSPATKSTANATVGQKNALKKAKSYIAYAAFSYQGLIGQLEYDDFSQEDATYGADNCGADWNEQAEKKAKSYLDYSAFSRESLIEQLEYDGFTHEQATHGAEANGY